MSKRQPSRSTVRLIPPTVSSASRIVAVDAPLGELVGRRQARGPGADDDHRRGGRVGQRRVVSSLPRGAAWVVRATGDATPGGTVSQRRTCRYDGHPPERVDRRSRTSTVAVRALGSGGPGGRAGGRGSRRLSYRDRCRATPCPRRAPRTAPEPGPAASRSTASARPPVGCRREHPPPGRPHVDRERRRRRPRSVWPPSIAAPLHHPDRRQRDPRRLRMVVRHLADRGASTSVG